MRNLKRLHQLGAVPHWPHAPVFFVFPRIKNSHPPPPPRQSQKGRIGDQLYAILTHLMSKMRVELGGMPAIFCEPYASLAGIRSLRSPPTLMPATPRSHPTIRGESKSQWICSVQGTAIVSRRNETHP